MRFAVAVDRQQHGPSHWMSGSEPLKHLPDNITVLGDNVCGKQSSFPDGAGSLDVVSADLGEAVLTPARSPPTDLQPNQSCWKLIFTPTR
jgi:hypothetical protein